MPSPYSYDLRIRALKMIDEGILITQVSKLLKSVEIPCIVGKIGVIIQETSKQDLATKRAITIKSAIWKNFKNSLIRIRVKLINNSLIFTL
ncbi:hypothetical protein Psal027_02234 [Piscirickettsia salmonis]|nr:hypothetical protein AVI52_04955 [Piscirickettsia salmonis]APS58893.1 hypothetical protein AVI52_16750 [Piscirickettsia salmonis]QGN77997.1 hypothetical protein Psal001_02217 [Piscirickettsia salmonis]QGN81579.1 hypothetical protein Psal002_02234 [Piscirickettsia salmonis]QGN84148.1 hypothetical protein Psal003_01197 [Piscirickettsia salmonis]